MKGKMITISNDGTVTVPDDVKMTIGEIADLLGIYYQAAKKNIRSIEKSGIADGDYSMCCTVEGEKVYPEYYGLDMVIAVAFKVQSVRAYIFRRWLIRRISRIGLPQAIMLPLQNVMLN